MRTDSSIPKGITIDGRVSCYGTANMDIRSFELNFEVNATIYDEEVTGELEEAFMNDLPTAVRLKEDYMDRSLLDTCEGAVQPPAFTTIKGSTIAASG